jgi:hypothetical protein
MFSRLRESAKGAAGGFVAGALLGGPVGAVGGAVFGGAVGRSNAKDKEAREAMAARESENEGKSIFEVGTGHVFTCEECKKQYSEDGTGITDSCPDCRPDVRSRPSRVTAAIGIPLGFVGQAATKAFSIAKAPVALACAESLPLKDPVVKAMAIMSNEMYAAPGDRITQIGKYRLVTSLNKSNTVDSDGEVRSNRMAAYCDDSGNMIVAFRGSQDKKDWLFRDAQIVAIGLPRTSVPDAMNFFKAAFDEVQRLHGGCNGIRFTGHSLGGTIAQCCIRRIIGWRNEGSKYFTRIQRTHVFNPATCSNAGGGQLDRAAWTRLVDGKMPLTVHRCFGDPVSSGVWMYVGCIDYRPIRANVHSIENFLG